MVDAIASCSLAESVLLSEIIDLSTFASLALFTIGGYFVARLGASRVNVVINVGSCWHHLEHSSLMLVSIRSSLRGCPKSDVADTFEIWSYGTKCGVGSVVERAGVAYFVSFLPVGFGIHVSPLEIFAGISLRTCSNLSARIGWVVVVVRAFMLLRVLSPSERSNSHLSSHSMSHEFRPDFSWIVIQIVEDITFDLLPCP